MAGFYRGLTLSIVRAIPSNACAYFVYEALLQALDAEKVGCYYTIYYTATDSYCIDADMTKTYVT